MGGEGHVVKEAHEYSPIGTLGPAAGGGAAADVPMAKTLSALSPAGADAPGSQ